MDEITPDLVARMASRVYNEGISAPGQAAGPSLPASPSASHASPASVQHGHVAESTPYVTGQNPSHLGRLPHQSHPSGPGSSSVHPSSIPGSAVSPSFGNHATVPNHVPAYGGMAGGSPGSAPISAVTNQGIPFSSPASSGFPSPGHNAVPDFFKSASSRISSPTLSAPMSHGPSHSTGGSSHDDGLKRFVSQIRMTHADRSSSSSTSNGPSPFTFHPRIDPTSAVSNGGSRPFDVNAIRADFPILHQLINGKPLAWFDNAATTQKPRSVIDAISRFYEQDNSNIHRAAHTLAARSTDAYEKAREKIRSFIGAADTKEIVFVRGTTEGINLVVNTYGRKFLQPGDEIVLSQLEHHANIVPWQTIAKEKGAVLRVIPVNDRGEVMLEEYQKLLGPRTKVVALTQASNSLGTVLPVAEMTAMAKRYNARVLIDGAQSVAHIPVNVEQMGADFFVFSGHKIFGPNGIGAVYIREELHDVLPPWQGGGNMIRNVTFEETTYSEAPAKFEAGTPNVADAVGLGAALDYVNHLGLPNIAAYEHELLGYATERMLGINGLRLVGTAREKVGVLSFVLPHKRTEEIGRALDQEGIAVRAGHHCSQPSLRRFGLETTVRPSLSFYNTKEEIDRLVAAIKRICLMP
ncbi:MAG: cysteine desulfurase [Pirellulales bacterium]